VEEGDGFDDEPKKMQLEPFFPRRNGFPLSIGNGDVLSSVKIFFFSQNRVFLC